MELSQFWTATAPLSSVWADVASVADPAQESSQPFRVTSSRERRAKKDGNAAPAAKACASTPKVALNCASRGRAALGEAATSRRPFSRSHRQSVSAGVHSARERSLAVMASFSSFLRLPETFLPWASSAWTASASWSFRAAPEALRLSTRRERATKRPWSIPNEKSVSTALPRPTQPMRFPSGVTAPEKGRARAASAKSIRWGTGASKRLKDVVFPRKPAIVCRLLISGDCHSLESCRPLPNTVACTWDSPCRKSRCLPCAWA